MPGDLIRCPHCGQTNRVPAAAAGTPRCGKCHQPLPWIADADDTTFGDIADAAKIPVIVDLWAPWCGPCRMVSPALEQLARDLAGQVKLVKVNVDVAPQLSQRFGAQAIPTLLVLRGGQVVARQTGAAPLAALRAWVDKALATAAPWGPANRAVARWKGPDMAASYPDDLRYHREHDWARVQGDEATCGITWHAQDSLGEVVYLDLPEVGSEVTKDQPYGQIESVKTVSDLFAPLSGEIVQVNDALGSTPEAVNEDPYGRGWLVKVKLSDPSEADSLMSAEEYQATLGS